MVVVKNGKAVDLLKIVTPLETVTANNIQDSSEATATVSGVISNRLFDEVLACLYMEGRHPTVTAVELKNPSKEGETSENVSSTQVKTTAVISGSAAFKKDKLVGYLDAKESLGYTIIRDKTQSITISFPCDNKGNYGNVIFDKVSDKIGIKFNKNKPVANLNISGEGALAEYNCNTDLSDEKNIENIKKLTTKEINKIIKKTIDKSQKELKSDILGFGEQIYKNSNSYWQKNKKNWDKIFSTMDYKIKTNITIKRIGSTVNSGKESD
jgi:spore germination protein KC